MEHAMGASLGRKAVFALAAIGVMALCLLTRRDTLAQDSRDERPAEFSYRVLGALDVPLTMDDVAADGDYLYVVRKSCAPRSTGVTIFEITGSWSILQRGTFCQENTLFDVAAEDGIAVVQSNASDEYLVLLDASDPDQPVEASRLTETRHSDAGISLINGRLALRYAEYDHTPLSFELFDVSTVTEPRSLAQLELDLASPFDSSDGFAERDGFYYMFEDDLRVLRLEEDGVLRQVGRAPVPGRTDGLSPRGLDRLTIDGERSLLIGIDDRHLLWAYDIAQPERPLLLASAVPLSISPLDDAPGGPLPLTVHEMIVRDGLAWVTVGAFAAATSRTLDVFDLDDPTQPRHLGRVPEFRSRAITLNDEGYLVSVGYGGKLDPNTGSELGSITVSSISRRLFEHEVWIPALNVAR